MSVPSTSASHVANQRGTPIGTGATNTDGTTSAITKGAKGAFYFLADTASLIGKRTYQTAAAFANPIAAPITAPTNLAANALAQQSDMSRGLAGLGGSLLEGLSKLIPSPSNKGNDKQQMAQKAGGGCPDGNCGKASAAAEWEKQEGCSNGQCRPKV